MGDLKDGISYTYQDCVAYACDPDLTTEEIIGWLERALEIAPDRLKDVLRIAKGLRSLSERTAGQAYIAELEKLP